MAEMLASGRLLRRSVECTADGFYAPAQIVRDAQQHDVEIRPVCVNASRWDCTMEPSDSDDRLAVRLGLRMVKGLVNAQAAAVLAARSDCTFSSVEDLWQRAGVPLSALSRIAEADGFLSAFGLPRRDALWAIKGLRDEELPLFAAASKKVGETVHEVSEPFVELRQMAAGGEVVEDYGHVGLTLRDHPVSFLRQELQCRKIVSCSNAVNAKDRSWLEAAGIVLVRQRPGSAKGVMFIALEDETGIANLVVWPKLFETHRRIILSAGMISVRGRVQREGEVVHLVAHQIADLSEELASVGERDTPFPLPHGRGDEFHHGSTTPDPRGLPPKGLRTRDIYIRDLHIDAIKVKTRDFR
jgi:error-prone DNA polymerase